MIESQCNEKTIQNSLKGNYFMQHYAPYDAPNSKSLRYDLELCRRQCLYKMAFDTSHLFKISPLCNFRRKINYGIFSHTLTCLFITQWFSSYHLLSIFFFCIEVLLQQNMAWPIGHPTTTVFNKTKFLSNIMVFTASFSCHFIVKETTMILFLNGYCRVMKE